MVDSDLNGHSALTLRLLMQGNEFGSIIGKKGDDIKRFREVSGAKINVSDSSCPDRIVTLSGTLDEVYNAFSMICSKFEEQILQVNTSSGGGANSSFGSTGGSQTGIGPAGQASASATGQSPADSVNDPLFGLPSTGILNIEIKQERSLSGKEAELLTINNNSTTTINNNNINAPDKNLIANSNNNIQGNVTGSAGGATSPQQQQLGAPQNHPTVTIRLIVPASQYGSVIDWGTKIMELRELTSATIQLEPDVLLNSTELVLTISGNVNSLRLCTHQICKIMVQSLHKADSVKDHLFGLPSTGVLNTAIKQENSLSCKEAELPTINNNSTTTIIWAPDVIENVTDVELDLYLKFASTCCIPGGGCNIEEALDMLYKSNGDIKEATKRLLMRETTDSTNWTLNEMQAFEYLFRQQPKDFISISKNLKKPVKDCVRFYYLWKQQHPLVPTSMATPDPIPMQENSHLQPVQPEIIPQQQQQQQQQQPGVEQFPCKQCGRIFEKIKSRSAHMKRHKNEKRERK